MELIYWFDLLTKTRMDLEPNSPIVVISHLCVLRVLRVFAVNSNGSPVD